MGILSVTKTFLILLKCYLVHKRKRLKQVCLKQSSHQVAKVIPVEIKTALSSNALRKTPVSGQYTQAGQMVECSFKN